MSDKKEVIKSILTTAFGDGDKEQGVLYFDPSFLKHPLYKKAQDFTNGVYQGFTGGFSDELNGVRKGINYGGLDWYNGNGDGTFIGGFKRGYRKGRDSSRRDYAASGNSSPYLTTVGEFAGGLANPFLRKGSKYVQSAHYIRPQMARSVMVGMPFGAAYGAGKSTDDTVGGVAQDALIGAAASVPFSLAMTVPALYNLGQIKYGKYQIKKALNTQDFKDVNFGRIAKQDVDAINAIREVNAEPLMQNNKLMVPQRVLEKFDRKRIKENHWTPQELVDHLEDVFHSGKSAIMPSKYPQNQLYLNQEQYFPRVGFISVNPKKPTQNVIKSIYKTDEEDLNRVISLE